MNSDFEKVKFRILVVDDDELLNYLFCSFLNEKGFEAVSAFSLYQARNILKSDGFLDLMLLDYQLGDGLGVELLSQESIDTYEKIIPVIMISANEDPDFLEKCFSIGVNDYIIKPVNLSLLALKVEALIKSISMQKMIASQKVSLEKFKYKAEREEQIAKFTYEYLLKRYSPDHEGIDVWLKSYAAFSGDMAISCQSPSGSLFFMLADATGHGLSAAITIMPVLTIFNSMVSKGFHIQQIVAEINRKLVTDTPVDRFVACSVIEMDPFRREVSVWNGSMPSVYWIKDGKVFHEFKSTHMALGILDDDMFEVEAEVLSFPEDGFLFTFSDGAIEQQNAKRNQFGVSRILDVVKQQPKDLLAELQFALSRHAGRDCYDDDVSVCVLYPDRIFSDSVVGAVGAGEIFGEDATPFLCQLTLTGKKLDVCQLPPLLNHFLQQVGCEHVMRQKIFTIAAEMVSNAIDHGILKLSSELKNNPEGFEVYFSEREKRIQELKESDSVTLKLVWNSDDSGNHLVVEVEDSGEGYDFEKGSKSGRGALSGRGVSLIKQLSESVEIIPPGNRIIAVVK